jgi:hypothetical protein
MAATLGSRAFHVRYLTNLLNGNAFAFGDLFMR